MPMVYIGYPNASDVTLDYNISTQTVRIYGSGMYQFPIYFNWGDFTHHVGNAYVKKIIFEEGITGIHSIDILSNSPSEISTFLKQISIPSTVASISDNAFEFCVNSKIILAENNPNFMLDEYDVLYNKEKTKLIFVSKSKELKDDPWYTTYTIPDGVITIGAHSFAYCTWLDSVQIPDSVTKIEDYAFDNCGLTEIDIPNSVTTIGGQAFANCKFTTIHIPDSVTTIEGGVFLGSKLESIVWPSQIKSIPHGAFEYCFDLRSVVIPDTVTTIENSAFVHSGVKTIHIPPSVTSIAPSAFNHCHASIYVFKAKNSIAMAPWQIGDQEITAHVYWLDDMLTVTPDVFYAYSGYQASFHAKLYTSNGEVDPDSVPWFHNWKYTWQISTDNGETWTNIDKRADLPITVIQGKQIKLTVSQQMDGYLFRCVTNVSTNTGTETATSQYARLSVREKDSDTTSKTDVKPTGLRFDTQNSPLPIRMILATRSGSIIREMPINHVKFRDDLGNGSEISFLVYKNRCENLDGDIDQVFWDKIENLRLGYCPEFDQWYELQMEATDSSETVKSVTAVSLGEAELNQIKVYGIEVNTESDIAREDYKPTVLFDAEHKTESLIDRLLYKAPHYKVTHVDESLCNLQRTFQFNNKTVYECFQEIAKEVGCLFRLECRRTDTKNIVRSIQVFDLWNMCLDCGERGEFMEVCDKCGGTNIQHGYGEDTSVYVDKDNLAEEITFSTDVGSIKNCFRMNAGDDLMTAAIISCNPNGSQYIWYIPEYMQEDMSDALKDRLNAYNKLYDYYQKEHTIVLSYIIPDE